MKLKMTCIDNSLSYVHKHLAKLLFVRFHQNDWATGSRKKLSRLDTIHERDRQTGRQTDGRTETGPTAKTALTYNDAR